MRNIRVFVVLLLLAIGAPVAIHYRAWSLGLPDTTASSSSNQFSNNKINPRETRAQATNSNSDEQPESRSSQSMTALDLPNGSSSLPLLSVIGFGIFLGGLISALRTRPAHK